MALLELHDKLFNYLLQVENEYNKVAKRFDLKTKEYFDALRELRNQYFKDYAAIEAEANKLIYGNPEGKLERKHRDRSGLYLKVVKRSQKYKTWRNFFTAIGAAAAFIALVQILFYLLKFRTPCASISFDMVSQMVVLTAAWAGVLFESVLFFKSFKYLGNVPANNKAERKWLKKYFDDIHSVIGARAYLDVLVQREENIEKYLECAERSINRDEQWQKIANIKSEVIYEMKKDIEKVMDDFMYDGELYTALDYVLESWKKYQ